MARPDCQQGRGGWQGLFLEPSPNSWSQCLPCLRQQVVSVSQSL